SSATCLKNCHIRHAMDSLYHLEENVFDLKYEPLAGSSLTNLLRLASQNKFMVSARYMPRMLYATMMSSIIAPFRLKEYLQFNKKIQQTKLTHPPLFIIGHWRSGTTYVHNVLSLDATFGYCTTFTATIPGVFLGSEKMFKPVLAASIPEKRPMDEVPMGTDLPQEEEYAIGAFIPYAYYNGWCFPRNMGFYNRFVTMEDASPAVIDEWKTAYQYFLQKLTYYRGGKRLVLKNPAHTARIKLLLEMFPDAQFINIYRNPYHLYYSMMRFLQIVVPRYCVQRPDMHATEEHMIDLYARFYKKYFEERHLIPEGNLVEVKYEDFIENPMKDVEMIYRTLDLHAFTNVKSSMCEYTGTQKYFKASSYTVDPEVREKLSKKWKTVFDEFGYEP
ncbi:MAG TPA: sulfotransferase, partial [Candidatus Thermoplasmatota archaeon]|nr:sulfotransferase [Candidatus Thermoplasmatota archaeon]